MKVKCLPKCIELVRRIAGVFLALKSMHFRWPYWCLLIELQIISTFFTLPGGYHPFSLAEPGTIKPHWARPQCSPQSDVTKPWLTPQVQSDPWLGLLLTSPPRLLGELTRQVDHKVHLDPTSKTTPLSMPSLFFTDNFLGPTFAICGQAFQKQTQ